MAEHDPTPSERRQFQIRHCVGAGGFGEVYVAAMRSAAGVTTEVAVKVLHENLDPHSQPVQRLKDEAHLLAALNHPTIVRVNDLVFLEGRIALVTEYVDGADLETFFEGERLPHRALIEVTERVAEALHVAWSARTPDGKELRLIHRDIKPANIRISRHGEVKLLDFGIARTTTDNLIRSAKTQDSSVVGSLLYMAPERLDGDAVVGAASDIFSLGVTLYQGLSGACLFGELSPRAQFGLACSRDKFDAFVAEHLSALLPDTPAPMVDLLLRMLAFSPEERPSAVEVVHECEQLAATLSGSSLKRLCRDHVWPTPSVAEGALANRTIVETTLGGVGPQHFDSNVPESARPTLILSPRAVRDAAAAEAASHAPSRPKRRVPSFLLGAGVLGVTGTVAAVVAVLGLVGGGAWYFWPRPAQVSDEPAFAAPLPLDPVVVAEQPSPPPTVATEPVPPTAPIRPTHTEVVAPALPKVVAAPPAPAELGFIEVKGGVPVEFRSGTAAHPAGPIPAGTYEMWADFGDGFWLSRTVVIKGGEKISIRCKKSRSECLVAAP